VNPHAPAGTEIWLPSTGRNSDFSNDFYVLWGFPDTVRDTSSLQLRCRAGRSYPSPHVAVVGINMETKGPSLTRPGELRLPAESEENRHEHEGKKQPPIHPLMRGK